MPNILISNLSDIDTLALTIIGEAEGEPIQGQVAVGAVIRNRLHENPSKYKNYKDVCLEPKHFSCWNLNDPNYVKLTNLALDISQGKSIKEPARRQCFLVARGIAAWDILDNTKGATHYMTTELLKAGTVKWAKNPKSPIEHGHQTFFNV